MNLLLKAGANDVWYTPIYMKKNRPAYMLSVLCRESNREVMEDIIFTHTTSIGIRRFPAERTALDRRKIQVETAYGTADVKVCSRNMTVFLHYVINRKRLILTRFTRQQQKRRKSSYKVINQQYQMKTLHANENC